VTRRSGTRIEVADVSTMDREEVLAIATFCTSAHRTIAMVTTGDLRIAEHLGVSLLITPP
jgi:hypothetical protein